MDLASSPLSEKTPAETSYNNWLLFVAILIAAAALRIYGIWHGYPYSYNIDEYQFVKKALAFGDLDFNPHWFHKPAFFMYLLFFEYGVFFFIGKLLGLWASTTDFAVSFITHPGPFYLIGRFTNALFSLGTLWFVYKLGERHFKKGVGLIGALLLALSYGHILAGHVVKADIPAVFFGTGSMYFLLNYLNDSKLKSLGLSVIFAGIGTAAKYYPEVMLLPIFLSVLIVISRSSATLLYKVGKIIFFWGGVLLLFFLIFFICAPYSFLDPLGRQDVFGKIVNFYQKISHLTAGAAPAVASKIHWANRLSIGEGAMDYLRVLFRVSGMGPVITLVSLLGAFLLCLKIRLKEIFIFLLYPLLFVFISVFQTPGYTQVRHQIPIYPFLAIAGGVLITALAGDKGLRQKIVISLLLLLLLHPLTMILKRGILISKEDTRNLSKKWVETNIPPGTRILMDENGPPLLMNEKNIQDILDTKARLIREVPNHSQFNENYGSIFNYQLLAAKKTDKTYDVTIITWPWWKSSFTQEGTHHLLTDRDIDYANPLMPVGVHSYDYYVKNGYQYVIVNKTQYKKYSNPQTAKAFPTFARFYESLFKRGKLVKEFSSAKENRPGPPVQIFKLEKE